MNIYLFFHFACLFLVLFHVVGKAVFGIGFIPEIALAGNYALTFSFVPLFLESWEKDTWGQMYVRILKVITTLCGSIFLFFLVVFPLVPVGALIITYTLPLGKVSHQQYYIDTPTRVGMRSPCGACDYYLHKTLVGIFDVTTQEVDVCTKSRDCFEPKSIKVDATSRRLYIRLETIEDSKFSEGVVKRDTTIVIPLK
jgi:hypothetical protein